MTLDVYEELRRRVLAWKGPPAPHASEKQGRLTVVWVQGWFCMVRW